MKKITKIITGTSLSILTLYSIPFGLYINQKMNDDYISFYGNNAEVYKKSDEDLSYLLDGKDSEEKAKLIELAFYKNAIYGFKYEDEAIYGIKDPTEESIAFKYPGIYTKDKKDPYNFDYENLHKAYTFVSIYNETTKVENSVSISSYLATQAQANPDIISIAIPDITSEFETLADWIKGASYIGNEENDDSIVSFFKYSETFNALDQTIDNDLAASKFIYQLMYLFQASDNLNYDYKVTEKLKKQELMFVWNANLSNVNNLGTGPISSLSTFNGENFDSIKSIYDYYLDKNEEVDSSVSLNDINVNQEGLLLDLGISGDMGYKGILSSASSGLTISDKFWDYTKSWEIISNDVNSWSTIKKGYFTDNGLSGDFYISSAAGNKIITGNSGTETEISGTGQVVKAASLYPFIFAQGYQESTGYANRFYYSIEAVDNKNETYSKLNKGDMTTDTVDLIDIVYGDLYSDSNIKVTTPEEILGKEIFIVYILDTVIKNDSNSMLNTQFYWKNRGYYIKLSGKMNSIYGSLIDSGIQSKD